MGLITTQVERATAMDILMDAIRYALNASLTLHFREIQNFKLYARLSARFAPRKLRQTSHGMHGMSFIHVAALLR